MMRPFPKFYCPRCNSELRYVLYVPPKYTKTLNCSSCGLQIIIPVQEFDKMFEEAIEVGNGNESWKRKRI